MRNQIADILITSQNQSHLVHMSQVLFIVATDSECGIGLHWWPSKLLDCLHSWSGLLHHLTVSPISCKGKHTNVPFHFCTNQTQSVTHSDTAETCKHDLFWILGIKNFRYIQTVHRVKFAKMWSEMCVQVIAYKGLLASSGWSLGIFPRQSEWWLVVAGKPPSAEAPSRTRRGRPAGRTHAAFALRRLQCNPEHTQTHTNSVSKEPKNLSRTDTAEIWSTHCGRNDGRSAGPQFSCLRWIWFVDHFQPPFDIVSLDLQIGVNYAVFKAHLASILESHLSFCLMIEHLEESVNKKEVRKTQQDTKVAVCWWKNREINLAFDVRKHRDRQRVAKESKKCESWTNSEDSNVIVIAIAEIFAVTFDFYLVLVVCEMHIFMLLTFSTYWIHNKAKWPAQLWVSSKRTWRPKSTTVGSTL